MTTSYLGIEIDLDRDASYGAFPLELLKKHYLKPGEISPQYAFARAATNFCYGDYGLAQRIYNYVSQQWACFASPIISNAILGTWNETVTNWNYSESDIKARKDAFSSEEYSRAMPISCFLTDIPDTL